MPNQAPTYGDLRVRSDVRPAPTLDPRAINANTYGAGLAQAAAGAASEVLKVQEEERQKAIKVDVFKATNDLDISRTKLAVGFRSLQGQNAFEKAPKVQEEYRKRVSEITQSLTSPEAKEAFGRYAQSSWVDVDRDVQEHVARERKSVERTVYETRRDLTIESAVANRNRTAFDASGNPTGDPDGNIHMELQKLEGMHLVRVGETGTQETGALEALTKADRAAVWANVIDADLKEKNYTEAKRRFDENKHNLTSDQIKSLEPQIKEGVSRHEAMAEADRIISSPSGELRSTAFSEVNKIPDPDKRMRVEARLDQHFSRREQQIREENKIAFQEAVDALESSDGDLDSIPVGRWQSFDLDDRQRLEARSEQLRKKTEVADGSPKYWEMRQLMSAPELHRQFLQADLTKLSSAMSRRDLNELMDKQASLRSKGGESADIKGINSEEQVINQALIGADINPAMSMANPDAKRVIAFRNSLQTAVLAESSIQGRSLKPEEVGKLAGKLMATQRITKTGLFWDSEVDVHLFELPNAGRAALSVDQIPQDKSKEIRGKFEKTGRPFTDADVVSYYNDTLNPGSATNAQPAATEERESDDGQTAEPVYPMAGRKL